MKALELPTATPAQWEAAFRRMEVAYARNKSRRWVLVCLCKALKDEAGISDECAENKA